MLYNLIEFGGFLFWSLVIIDFLFLSYLTSDGGIGSSFWFFISIGLFYGLSNPPVISWQYCLSYLCIGVVWCLFMFRYKLGKLKKYLKENPHYMVAGEVNFNVIPPKGSDVVPHEIKKIHSKEPSFDSFISRIFCWPMNILNVVLSDFVEDLYNKVSDYLISYKNRFLAG